MISFDLFTKAKRMEESFQQQRTGNQKHTGKRTREEEVAYGKDSNINFKFVKEGIAFSPGIHGPSQAKDRRPDMTQQNWKKFHQKVFWHLKDNRIKEGVFLFYTKEFDQAYIASVGKPRSSDRVSARTVVRIITVLPKGKKFAKPGTDEVMMEVQYYLNDNMLFEKIEDIQHVYL